MPRPTGSTARLIAARHAAVRGVAGRSADRRTLQAAVRHGPLHRRADEDRCELNALRAAARAAVASRVDLVAVILVIGHPVDVIQRAVIAAQGIVIVVPEALQAFFLAGQIAIAMSEDVPPGLL